VALEPLASLLEARILPEPARVNRPTTMLLTAPLVARSAATAAGAYETTVLNFLLAEREHLGISHLWRCRSSRVDALAELDDGRRIGIEIKYRMNWEKACQAGHQFTWYRERVQTKETALAAGVVVFERFSGDWARHSPSRVLENGWNYWYADHHDVDGLRIDLIRLSQNGMETYPEALAAAQAAARASQ
jgi:hypothetical protein